MKAGQLSWTFLFLTLGVAAAQPSSRAKQDPLGIEMPQPVSSSKTNTFTPPPLNSLKSDESSLDIVPLVSQPLSLNATRLPKRLTADEFLDALPETVEETKAKAEKGDAQAQLNLGVGYTFGLGVPKDNVEAVKWYRKAAEQNDATAQWCLGRCYAKGQGVPKDISEAVKWCRKSAEQGFAAAEFNLGMAYQTGDGVPKNYVVALKWLHLAAVQNIAAAGAQRDKLITSMTPQQVYQGMSLANEFKPTLDLKPVSSKALPDFGTEPDAKLPDFGPAQPVRFQPPPPESLEQSAVKFTPPPAANPYEKMVDTGESPYTKLTPPFKVQTADDILGTKTPSADDILAQPGLDFVKPSGSSLRIGQRTVPTSSEQSDAALQIQRAAYERWLEQLKQEQALKDIAWQLELLRCQQEDEAMRQRISSLPVLPLSVSPPLDPVRIAKEYDLPAMPVLAAPHVVVSANSYDPNSLANPYGAGSPYKADGLMNPYSQYGSPYSSKSWRNPYATDAPKLYDSQGNYAGKLSSNPYDPDSTANPYGRYGSPYSLQSINNPYGLGSPYRTDPVYVVPSP